MKRWLTLPFMALLLALAAACGGGESVAPDASFSQYADEIKKDAVELFDDWTPATQSRDVAAIFSLMSKAVTGRCTLEQMEAFFEIGKSAFTYPEMDVTEVFVAPGNANMAFMTMELRNEPADGEQGIRDSYVASMPYAIVREDGSWRMVIQMITLGDGCPFVYRSSQEEPVPAEGQGSKGQ